MGRISSFELDIISYISFQVPENKSSKLKLTFSPTDIGSLEGRGEVLQYGVGGFKDSTTMSKIAKTVNLNISYK